MIELVMIGLENIGLEIVTYRIRPFFALIRSGRI